MSNMKTLEQTLREAPMADLAFVFQCRLLEQDGINLINGDVLGTIANCAEAELVNRMAPVAEKEFCYD
jgi:hypothetical protein